MWVLVVYVPYWTEDGQQSERRQEVYRTDLQELAEMEAKDWDGQAVLVYIP